MVKIKRRHAGKYFDAPASVVTRFNLLIDAIFDNIGTILAIFLIFVFIYESCRNTIVSISHTLDLSRINSRISLIASVLTIISFWIMIQGH